MNLVLVTICRIKDLLVMKKEDQCQNKLKMLYLHHYSNKHLDGLERSIQELKDIVRYLEYGGIDLKFNTYEEAELACLDKLIEIVETKQQVQ
jgi:hypothetical protein